MTTKYKKTVKSSKPLIYANFNSIYNYKFD